MFELFATPRSGNCFKPFLVLRQLHIPFKMRSIDVLAGETKTDAFLSMNPVGTTPYLRIAGGAGLSESNAMLWFLADGSHLIPSRAFDRAKGLQWMFFEQCRLEPFISPARVLTTIAPDRGIGREEDIENLRRRAHAGLALLDAHLGQNDFVAGTFYSIADVGVYGYVHLAPEGGISLDDYASIRAWIERVGKTSEFAPIEQMNAALSQLSPRPRRVKRVA